MDQEIEVVEVSRNRVVPPAGLKTTEQRREMAAKLRQWSDAGLAAHAQLEERWEANEQGYRNQPDEEHGFRPTKESPVWNLNLIQPRVDALVSKVCNPLLSQRPYFSALGYKDDKARFEPVQQSVQFCLEGARFSRKLRQATRIACCASPCFYRVWFDATVDTFLPMENDQPGEAPFGYVGPVIDVLHPGDCFLWPLGLGIKRAKIVGHRFEMRLQEIRELQKIGSLFTSDTDFTQSDASDWNTGRDPAWSKTDETTNDPQQEKPEGEPEQIIEVRECIVKLDLDDSGHEKRWRMLFAPGNDVLLDAQEYEYSRPWYFEHFLREGGYGETYHSNPPVTDIQGLQAAFNDLWTIFIEGQRMTAFPPGFLLEGQGGGQPFRYEAATMYPRSASFKVEWLDSAFKPEAIPFLMQTIERIADAAFRISQAATAQKQSGDPTATEIAAVQAGQEEGADEYRDNASASGEEIADFVRELCYLHYPLMKEVYAEGFPCSDASELAKPLKWEATGKTPTTNPNVIQEALRMILELAKNPPIDPETLQPMRLPIRKILQVMFEAMNLPITTAELFPETKTMEGPNGQAQPLGPGAGPQQLIAQLAPGQMAGSLSGMPGAALNGGPE